MDSQFEYLKLQYQEALEQGRCYLGTRYKILSFVGFYNGAILTFGFGQEILSTHTSSAGAIFICILSIIVALMGFATEFALSSYMGEYFKIIREIESKLSGRDIEKIRVFSNARNSMKRKRYLRPVPLNLSHRIFYIVLTLFWLVFCGFQIKIFIGQN
jgi:hypothetical protein